DSGSCVPVPLDRGDRRLAVGNGADGSRLIDDGNSRIRRGEFGLIGNVGGNLAVSFHQGKDSLASSRARKDHVLWKESELRAREGKGNAPSQQQGYQESSAHDHQTCYSSSRAKYSSSRRFSSRHSM